MFSDAAEYLAYLQTEYAKPYSDGTIQDTEFHRLAHEEARRVGISLPSGPIEGISNAVKLSYDSIIHALSPEQQSLLGGMVAAGVVEGGEANAFIAKSPNGKFAILLFSGLAIFLHKYTKLVAALVDLKSVTYCNRKSPELLTRDDVQSYMDEMIECYVREGVPRGPFIRLQPREAAHASWMLKMAETFVLCHELGHFFNGDLNDESKYSALPRKISGKKFEENVDHEVEYRADNKGYQLYLRATESIHRELPPYARLAPITLMFDLLFKFAGGASSSHPHPNDRVVRIVRDYFGSDLSERFAEGLKNPRLLYEIFPVPPPLST